MNHPCNQFSCPEYNQGRCFGGGCRTNPMPEREDSEEGGLIMAETHKEEN